MSKDITFYIDRALQRSGSPSNRKLCNLLGVSPNTITYYSKKRALPSEETMIKLANLANIPPEQALLDLNIWRSEGAAKSIYAKIYENMRSTMHLLSVIGVLLIFTTPAYAENMREHLNINISNHINYHIFIKKLRFSAYKTDTLFLHENPVRS